MISQVVEVPELNSKCDKRWCTSHHTDILSMMCFKKNVTLFTFAKMWAKYYPISIIFGSTIPKEICNKSMHVYPPHLFTVLIPYLVKIMILLPVLYIVLKSGPFAVCNKFARCYPNLIILANTCQKNFVTKINVAQPTKSVFLCCNCTL